MRYLESAVDVQLVAREVSRKTVYYPPSRLHFYSKPIILEKCSVLAVFNLMFGAPHTVTYKIDPMADFASWV